MTIALTILSFIWRFKWVFAGIAVYLAFKASCVWIGHITDQRDKARQELQTVIETNQATMDALDAVKAEKARNETLLADRAARKSKEADQLSAIIKRINEADDTNSCPSMPIIDGAIDGVF